MSINVSNNSTQAKLFRLPSYIFRFKDGSLAGSTCIRCTPQTTSSSRRSLVLPSLLRCCSSSDVVFCPTRRGAASRRAETDVHGERSKRRRGGRRRGELTGSQQVTASPSFYYLLSLSRSSGYSLSFPPHYLTPFPVPPSFSILSFDSCACISVSLGSCCKSDSLFVRRMAKRSFLARQQYRCIPE